MNWPRRRTRERLAENVTLALNTVCYPGIHTLHTALNKWSMDAFNIGYVRSDSSGQFRRCYLPNALRCQTMHDEYDCGQCARLRRCQDCQSVIVDWQCILRNVFRVKA